MNETCPLDLHEDEMGKYAAGVAMCRRLFMGLSIVIGINKLNT